MNVKKRKAAHVTPKEKMNTDRRSKSCGKTAPCKLLETGVPTALGNPATDAGFPLFTQLQTTSNNNKLDDRDHFLENATASVASLRGRITSTQNADHDQLGIRSYG
jgi:hypothetical protein